MKGPRGFERIILPLLIAGFIIAGVTEVPGQQRENPTEATGMILSEILNGRIRIRHPGFGNHEFVKSYVYVLELNRYYELSRDGSFSISGLPDGRYSIRTYVPGFELKYATVHFPDQNEIVIDIDLQTVELREYEVANAIPRYLKEIRDSTTSDELLDDIRPDTPIPLPSDGANPGLSLNGIIDVFRNLFRRDEEKKE